MAIEQGPGYLGGGESESGSETISERKLLNIISAVGNHEAKALLLVLMQDDVIYTRADMATLLNGAQETHRGWKRKGSELWRYCDQTFEQIGLVVQKPTIIGSQETVGFIKTEDGKTWGNAVAAAMLQLSARNGDYSLADMVGETASPSQIMVTEEGDDYRKRPVESRLKIYRRILDSVLPIRRADILQKSNMEKPTVFHHLQKLNEVGLIGYETHDHGKPIVFYQLAEELPKSDPKPLRNYKKMTNFIFGLLRDNPEVEWTREMVAKRYDQAHGKTMNKEKAEFITEKISRVFSHFERNGFVKRGKFSSLARSEVTLNPEQRVVVADIVETIDAVWQKDEQVARSSHNYISYLRSNKAEVTDLMIKAREHSTAFGKSSAAERREAIGYVVGSNPGETAKVLQGLLEKEGIKLSYARVSSYLRELTKTGRLEVTNEKDVYKYSVVDAR